MENLKYTFIWRVENEFGDGCYYGASNEVSEITKRHGSFGNPTPQDDYGIARGMDYNEICGFKTLKQAKNWFSLKELKELYNHGYELIKVRVSNITAIGEYQILAIK